MFLFNAFSPKNFSVRFTDLNTSYVPIQLVSDILRRSLKLFKYIICSYSTTILSPFSSPLSLKNSLFSTHFSNITSHNIHICTLFSMQGYFSIFCYFALFLLVRPKTYLFKKHAIYTAVSHSHFHIPPLPAPH